MCHHEHVLPKLQEEIDRICSETPPMFADMKRLPCLRACIREVLRWPPPVSTGIPHQSAQDEIYNVCLISKGSLMHPFERGMSRKAQNCPMPDVYNPERWVDPSFPTYQEPLSKYPAICQYSQYGCSRRTWQGQGVAEADLLCGIDAMAWVLKVTKAMDAETGIEIQVPETSHTELLIAKPKPFVFSMRPQNEKRRQRIRESFDEENRKSAFHTARQCWHSRNLALGWDKGQYEEMSKRKKPLGALGLWLMGGPMSMGLLVQA